MNELKDITALVLESIEEKLPSKTIFNLWFGNLELISLSDEKAVFLTPTALRKNIISTKYKEVLEKAIEDAIGFTVDIEVTSPPEDNTKIFSIDDEENEVEVTEDSKKETEKRNETNIKTKNKSLGAIRSGKGIQAPHRSL